MHSRLSDDAESMRGAMYRVGATGSAVFLTRVGDTQPWLIRRDLLMAATVAAAAAEVRFPLPVSSAHIAMHIVHHSTRKS